MSHVDVVTHRGHMIVHSRFAKGTDFVGFREILGDIGFVYAQIPQGKVLALVDFDGQILSQSEVNLIEAVAKANAETVQATALVGVAPEQRDLYEELIELMHRNARVFDHEAEALDWLAHEAEGLAWLISEEESPHS